MLEPEIRRRKKLLFTIDNLNLGNGMRQEGVEEPHVPDVHRDDRVSDWLAEQFDREGFRLDKREDIAIKVGDNEWRVIHWPKQEYGYHIERQGQTLSIYAAEHPHLRVLALDAGGIAGYFNARLLQKIHDRVREKVVRFQRAFQDYKSRLPLDEQAKLTNFETYINNTVDRI